MTRWGNHSYIGSNWNESASRAVTASIWLPSILAGVEIRTGDTMQIDGTTACRSSCIGLDQRM